MSNYISTQARSGPSFVASVAIPMTGAHKGPGGPKADCAKTSMMV